MLYHFVKKKEYVMKESFVFYRSFYDAARCLGAKAQLKLYESIMKLSFACCEDVRSWRGFAVKLKRS